MEVGGDLMVELGGDPTGPVGEKDCDLSLFSGGYSAVGLSAVGVKMALSTIRFRTPCLLGFNSFLIADGLS